MDPSEVFSLFSINRLDGEPVPDDLRILLPHRDELAGRSGIRLELDEDWAPWLDAGALARGRALRPGRRGRTPGPGRGLPAAARSSRPDREGQYLGYWRGPSHRKVASSPLVVLDDDGQFHLCVAPTFAEAVLERAYGREALPGAARLVPVARDLRSAGRAPAS